jgi:hypothetical protein
MEDLLNKISLKLNAKFSNAIISSELLYDFPVFTINSANIQKLSLLLILSLLNLLLLSLL